MTPELFNFKQIADGVLRIEPSYPATPGFKRNGTSQEAAPSAHDARILRDRVYDTLRQRGPLTPDEIAEYLQRSVLSIRPRCSELIILGKIAESGARRINQSGKMAAVLIAR